MPNYAGKIATVVATTTVIAVALLSPPPAHAGWLGPEAKAKAEAEEAAQNGAKSFGEEQGVASWYGGVWNGRRTASGEVFDMNAMTAAHHWLPFGTKVRVRLQDTGEQIVVTITDRLAAARRVIDLSQGAASALGMVQRGVAQVTIDPE